MGRSSDLTFMGVVLKVVWNKQSEAHMGILMDILVVSGHL